MRSVQALPECSQKGPLQQACQEDHRDKTAYFDQQKQTVEKLHS